MSMTGPLSKIIGYSITVGLISLILLTIGHELEITPTTDTQAHAFTVVLVLLVFFLVEFRKLYEVFSKEIAYQCHRCGRKQVRSEVKAVTIDGFSCESCNSTSFFLKQSYPTWVKSLGVIHATLTIALVAGFSYISFIGSFTALPAGVFQAFLLSLLIWPITLLVLARRVENPVRPKVVVCAECGVRSTTAR